MEPTGSKEKASSNQNGNLSKEKELLRKQLSDAARDEDDPLVFYERYVAWLIEHESQGNETDYSEILSVLEEAARTYVDDTVYKKDLRYLKLWIMYAKRVEKPEVVYMYVLENDIGTIYSQLYEEYALHLERRNRLKEAEEAYRLGLSRNIRAPDRLKNRFHEFQQRASSRKTLVNETKTLNPKLPDLSKGAKLYRSPLRYINKVQPKATKLLQAVVPIPEPPEPAPLPTDPYAFVRAGPAVGKKLEIFKFDIGLLFKDEREYCIQEARAQSLGLLDKKWSMPVMDEWKAAKLTSKVSEDEEDDDDDVPEKKIRGPRESFTVSVAGEPTVTINTKEALRDVFGMYNSPEKTKEQLDRALGSKHARVKEVERAPTHQPLGPLRKITEISTDKNFVAQKTPKAAAFRPFVDDENKKENMTPAPAKFTPFVDENSHSKTPQITPGARKGLALKELITPGVSLASKTQEGGRDHLTVLGNSEDAPKDSRPKSGFSRVFTPKSLDEKSKNVLQPKKTEVMSDTEDLVQSQQQQRIESQLSPPVPSSSVFRRPRAPAAEAEAEAETRDVFGAKTFHAPLASISKATSQVETKRAPVFRRISAAHQRQPFAPQRHARDPELPERDAQDEIEQTTEQDDDDDFLEAQFPGNSVDEQEPIYEDGEPYQAPMGGRFGQFDVMTPIAERTYEYTTSTKAWNSPTEGSAPLPDKVVLYHDVDAAAAAEKLAREVRDEGPALSTQEDESFESDDDDAQEVVEKTGTLSLADAIAVASSFRPANPCNPSDPRIINTLLSLIPPESDFHDVPSETSSRFNALQKFSERHSRRVSGARSLKTLIFEETFTMRLQDRTFKITEKLGEGGFGAVFKAKEVFMSDDEDDEDMDFDDDDDNAGLYALKVVKPRSIWEYHILRRIHTSLPALLRSSIIMPHALYAYRDESFLILDLCSQGTLLDVVNHSAQAGVSQQGACLDELLVMFFTIELLKFIEGMHSAGFIHGDLKIDNCLLRLEDVPGGTSAWSGMYDASGAGGWKHKGIKMIDFGRTIDIKMFPSDQTFVADWKTDVGDCAEMRENRPWTYQTDYFGLAGIIYCMLFGKYYDPNTVIPIPSSAPVRYKINQQFKRYWQVDIWTRLFDTLLNPTLIKADGVLPIVPELASLRNEMEAWLANNCNRSSNTLKGLLKKVELSALR